MQAVRGRAGFRWLDEQFSSPFAAGDAGFR